MGKTIDLGTVGLADFENLVNTEFKVAIAEGDEIDMPLTAAKAGKAKRCDAKGNPTGNDSFSLEFTAPPGVKVPQKTYHVSHDKLGEADLFLVPIGPAEGDETGAIRYQAVFT